METRYIAAIGIAVLLVLMVFWVNNKNKATTVCTNASGQSKQVSCKTAPCACPSGYSSTAWTPATYCENQALSLPYTDADGKKLQLYMPAYGRHASETTCAGTVVSADCFSDNAHQLSDDVAAGKDINIAKFGYNTYFGGDPCPSTTKNTTFNYRYV
jgi:hypothetical protein